MPTRFSRLLYVAVAVALAMLAAACSSGDDSSEPPRADGSGGFSALPANFDLAVDSPQAFLVGIAGPEQRSVAYGTVDVALAYLGPVGQPLDDPRPGPKATATFIPVAGTPPGTTIGVPQLLDGAADTIGVYGTEPLAFPDAGYWEATVRFTTDGRDRTLTAAFEVLDRHRVPAVGDQAPETVNAVAGASGVPPIAIDSRAADGVIPDPELHRVTIADALAARRPLTVVITTPAFCESRLCGPVTDAVAAVAARHGDRMDFVHLEVYAEVDEQRINPAAAEWILREGADGNEPWVFVINNDGIITHRFDNIANEQQIEAAVTEVVG